MPRGRSKSPSRGRSKSPGRDSSKSPGKRGKNGKKKKLSKKARKALKAAKKERKLRRQAQAAQNILNEKELRDAAASGDVRRVEEALALFGEHDDPAGDVDSHDALVLLACFRTLLES